jgi:exopolysaccharide biosynthesis polyprenyl glycosylphosphotransferase
MAVASGRSLSAQMPCQQSLGPIPVASDQRLPAKIVDEGPVSAAPNSGAGYVSVDVRGNFGGEAVVSVPEQVGGPPTDCASLPPLIAAPVSRPARAHWLHQYSRRLVGIDLVAVITAVGLAHWLRFGGLPGTGSVHSNLDYTTVSLAIAAAWLMMLSIYHARSRRIIGAGVEEYRRVWMATLSTFGAVAVVSMLFKLDVARGYLMIALPIGVVATLCGRRVARRMVAADRRKHGSCMTRVLVVGNDHAVKDLTQSLARDAASGYQVVGACVPGGYSKDSIEVPDVGLIRTHGDETQVAEAVAATGCDTVALTATERLGPRGIRALSWELEKLNVDLMVAPQVVDVAGPRLTMRPVAGLPLIHVEKPQYNGAKRFEKRAFDVVFSGLVLLFSLPLTVALAIAVKASSAGPVFYLSERIGLDSKPFQMIKFRTMVQDADRQIDRLVSLNEINGGVLFKIRRDPRVTPIGRVLRRYSLDEIPQFLNVLKGDMSVVGPRPPLAREVVTYDDEVKRRLLVRPGITGLWQVSGRSDLSWQDSVRLDLFYVENFSMVADFVIVVKTARAMLSGSGAY